MQSTKIVIPRDKILGILIFVASLLILANFAGQISKYFAGHDNIFGIIPLFDLDEEANFPTFFAVILLLFSSLLLGFIAYQEKKKGSTYSYQWTGLSLSFLFMAADEFISFHERLTNPIQQMLSLCCSRLGIFYYAWVVIGILLVLILALLFSGFIVHLPRKTRISFITSSVIYLSGAIGFELFGGFYAEVHGTNNVISGIFVTFEDH
jgi:hypothetical protein